ncbi:MAG: LysE family translocator [Methanolinea sp.]|jgi:threonine/homoserine/homoserine lactone efflux protein|nr:LysE family transporter [Methanolinea sp.]
MIQTFLLGVLIGLTGALVPGPTLVATINASVRGGWATGLRISAGHALVEACLFVLIIIGIGSVGKVQDYSTGIAVVGGIALLVFGILTIRSSGVIDMEGKAQSAVANPYLAGFLTSVANPYFWMWWLTVGSALLLTAAQNAFYFAVAFLIGHWSADFGWYTVVSASVHQGKKILDERAYTWILRGCGVFLMIFGLYYLVSAVSFLQ